MSQPREAGGVFPLPVGMRGFKLAFYGGFLTFVLFLVVTGWMRFGDRDIIFPTLIAVPTAALLVAHLVFLAFPSLEERFVPERGDVGEGGMSLVAQTEAEGEDGRTAAETQRLAVVTIAWCVVLPVLSYYLGFTYGLPLFIFGFVWYYRGELRTALVVTVAFSIAAYLFFIRVLRMIPWDGTLDLPNLLNMIPF